MPLSSIAAGSYEYVLTAKNSANALVNLTTVGGTSGGTFNGTFTSVGSGASRYVDSPSTPPTMTPITGYRYDALGNQIAQIRYAAQSVAIPTNGQAPAGTDSTNDQYSYRTFDALGRVIATTDAMGGVQNQSYDIYGNVVREWSTHNNVLGAAVNDLELYSYDELGRQIDTFVIDSSIMNVGQGTHATATFNAFGEQIAKAVTHQWYDDGQTVNDPIGDEFYDYDANGRIWQTNSGGVTEAYRYDLQGHVTQEAAIQGTASSALAAAPGIARLSSPSAVASATAIRTDTVYDALGRIQLRRDPDFTQIPANGSDGSSPVSIAQVTGTVSVSSFTSVPGSSTVAGEPTEYWVANNVNLSWTSLPAGTYKIYIEYTTIGGASTSYSKTITTTASSSVTTVTWQSSGLNQTSANNKKIAAINKVRIDQTSGTQQQIVRASGVSGNTVGICFPDNFAERPKGNILYYRLTSSSGAYSSVSLTALAAGGYTATLPSSLTAGAEYSYYFDTELVQLDMPVIDGDRFEGTFTVNGSTITLAAPAAQSYTPTHQQTTDRWGNVLSVSDPRNASWLTYYAYNDLNQVEQTIQPTVDVWGTDAVRTSQTPTSEHYYDSLGREVGSRDANGYLTTRVYDGIGNVISERRPDDSLWTWSYDTLGRLVQEGDGMGLAKTKVYDRLNRVTTQTQGGFADGNAHSTTYTYDGNSARLASETNAMSEQARYVYDNRGRLTQKLDPMWASSGANSTLKTTYTYDDLDRKASENNGIGNQSWVYDYFGRTLQYYALAGRTDYKYDAYGRLLQQVGTQVSQSLTTATGTASSVTTGGENLTYSYYENGWLKQVTDLAPSSGVTSLTTTYRYDLSGNRISERLADASGTRYADTHTAYDTLGRVDRVWDDDDDYNIAYGYDAVGNRRRVNNNWYLYDSQNRITLAQGIASGGTISVGYSGTSIAYDMNGNRAYASFQSGSLTKYHLYLYTPDHQLAQIADSSTTSMAGGTITNTRTYDLAGRLASSIDYSGATQTRKQLYYNKSGLLIAQYSDKSTNSGSTWSADSLVSYSTAVAPSSTAFTLDTAAIRTDRGNYNAAGMSSSYVVRVNTDSDTGWEYSNTYTYDYFAFGGGYKEARAKAVSSLSGYTPGTTTTTFDKHGNAIKVDNPYGDPKTQSFVFNSQGEIVRKDVIKKDNSTAYQKYYYSNGAPIASTGTLEGTTLDYNYTPISDKYPPTSTGQYVVQRDGESLQSISTSVYGDASLWYLIADANGLSGSETLSAGRALTIPNQVTNLHNNSQTYKPYSAGDIIDDTTPAMKAPKPPKHHCGGFGMILMVVVAIVVTIYTAGAAAGLLGAAATTTAGATGVAAVGGAALAGGSALAAAGTTGFVLGSATATAIAAAAVGAAVGSAASQLVGLAIGATDKFSWGQVGVSALSAGLTAGVGSALAPAANAASAASTTANASASQGFSWAAAGKGALQGALNSTVSQAANLALGEQSHFSWSSVAAGALTSGLGQGLGDDDPLNAIPGSSGGAQAFNFGNVLGDSVRGTAYGLINRSIVVALDGHGKVDARSIAADAFGNALGNSIVGAIEQSATERQGQEAERRIVQAQADTPGASSSDAAGMVPGAGHAGSPVYVSPQQYDELRVRLGGDGVAEGQLEALGIHLEPGGSDGLRGTPLYDPPSEAGTPVPPPAYRPGFLAGTDWSNELQFAADLGRNALRVGRGVEGAFGNAIYEPLAMAGDTTRIIGAGLDSLMTGTPVPTDIELYSSLGSSGMSTAETFGAMATGIVTAPYQIGFNGTTAILNGDPELFGANLGEGAMMLLGGRKAISEVAPEAGATLGASFYRMSGRIDHPSGADFALPAKESPNFANAQPIVLDEGTTIYRVVGGTARDNGPYWSLEPPLATEAAWRGGNAVLEEWGNPGTHYVEFTVPAGGLPAWSGIAASQGLDSTNALGWVQPGGANQVYIPTARTVVPSNLTRIPTPWSGP